MRSPPRSRSATSTMSACWSGSAPCVRGAGRRRAVVAAHPACVFVHVGLLSTSCSTRPRWSCSAGSPRSCSAARARSRCLSRGRHRGLGRQLSRRRRAGVSAGASGAVFGLLGAVLSRDHAVPRALSRGVEARHVGRPRRRHGRPARLRLPVSGDRSVGARRGPRRRRAVRVRAIAQRPVVCPRAVGGARDRAGVRRRRRDHLCRSRSPSTPISQTAWQAPAAPCARSSPAPRSPCSASWPSPRSTR